MLLVPVRELVRLRKHRLLSQAVRAAPTNVLRVRVARRRGRTCRGEFAQRHRLAVVVSLAAAGEGAAKTGRLDGERELLVEGKALLCSRHHAPRRVDLDADGVVEIASSTSHPVSLWQEGLQLGRSVCQRGGVRHGAGQGRRRRRPTSSSLPRVIVQPSSLYSATNLLTAAEGLPVEEEAVDAMAGRRTVVGRSEGER